MNDDEATRLLDELGTRVEVGPAPIEGILAAGDRVKNRRRGVRIAGVAAVAFALTLGGFVLRPYNGTETATPPTPTPRTTAAAIAPVPPPGYRLVGEGGVVVAVPASWSTNDISCSRESSNTVTFNNDGPWLSCAGGDPSASELSIVDSASTEWHRRLTSGSASPVFVDGLQGLRTVRECTTPRRGWVCTETLTFPAQQVSFQVRSSHSSALDAILDSAQRLPDGFVNVPDVAPMSVTEVRRALAAQGLVMQPACGPHDCTTYAVGTTPVAGSPVEVGSRITVSFYEAGYRNRAERAVTYVDEMLVRLRLPHVTVKTGRILRSRMLLSNPTGHPLTFDSCVTGSPRFGLQRVGSDHVDWRGWVVDCAGTVTVDADFRSWSMGPGFFAKTRAGALLQPGRYFAVVDFGDGSAWIRHEVTVLPNAEF